MPVEICYHSIEHAQQRKGIYLIYLRFPLILCVILDDKISLFHQPLALVAWGCRLEMAFVDSLVVRYFIRNKALKGPEGNYTKQGQYSQGLIAKSWGPSEDPKKDQILC